MFFSLLFVHLLLIGTAMFYFNSLLRSFCLPVLVALGVPSMDPELLAEDDADEVIVIADFEAESYGAWSIRGDAFGKGPALGTLDKQMQVSGYQGKGLVNTFHGGDKTIGSATSPLFVIRRPRLAFLIGGGRQKDLLAIQLLHKNRIVRTATGADSEHLLWASWDVSEFIGESVQVRIKDEATGGWGHICIDQIIQTAVPPSRYDLKSTLDKYRAQKDYMNEPLRPQFHFSSEVNWINDPNGLVYHAGEYHLFHQFNPGGNSWGNMSWGHAVSRDLLHWRHLPVALPADDKRMAFSGSCVVDKNNSSGFGKDGHPPLIAIYTGHQPGRQVQNLAYSNDLGRTWTEYDNNPVLDLKSPDFRDPKVFWHAATGKWVMVVSLAVEKVIVFYGSEDLKNWTELSRFGPAGAINKPNWECPDLFELPVEGEAGKKRWVLEIDMGNGAIAGGSGSEYFVGNFDGTRFQTQQHAQWVDHGRDFYAPISWENLPDTDGRRIWVGWFNNWQTSGIPTSPWRGCMTIPRVLSLRKVAMNDEEPATYALIQRPIVELDRLKGELVDLNTDAVSWPPRAITRPGEIRDLTFEIRATLKPGSARSVGLRLRTGDDEFTEIGYDRRAGGVYVDRNRSGLVNFNNAFAGRHIAPTRGSNDSVSVRILVDRSTLEVFVNDGESVISDRFFPTSREVILEAFAGNQTASIHSATLQMVNSVWSRKFE